MIPQKGDVMTLESDSGKTVKVKVLKEHSICRHYTAKDRRGRILDLFVNTKGEHFIIEVER